MGRVDAASRDIDRPAGVVFSRQISFNSVEPTIASRARNLLSHGHRGPCFGNEPKEVGPQMPCVVGATAFSGDRERLAGARAAPDLPVVGPSGAVDGEGPASDPGEEVALGESCEVGRLNIDN
jgi:hypothetical protein